MTEDRIKRMNLVNEFIVIIGSCGRKFFYNERNKTYGAMIFNENGMIYFVNPRSGVMTYMHTKKNPYSFNGGSTLWDLAKAFKSFIMTGIKLDSMYFYWPDYLCNGDLWGYGKDIEIVRGKAKELGIIE